MSENAARPTRIDARVRRTRDALGDALVALIQEKPFDSIAVQDVLDRAGVSRSTFYAHFESKDDLFAADAKEFLDAMAVRLFRTKEASSRIFPVRELLEHLREMRRFHAALVESGKIEDVLRLAQDSFARGIEERLTQIERISTSRKSTPEGRPWLAQAFAGALLALLTKWLTDDMPHEPAYMDVLFHRMVQVGLGSP